MFVGVFFLLFVPLLGSLSQYLPMQRNHRWQKHHISEIFLSRLRRVTICDTIETNTELYNWLVPWSIATRVHIKRAIKHGPCQWTEKRETRKVQLRKICATQHIVSLTNRLSQTIMTYSQSNGTPKSTHHSTVDHSWPNPCRINFNNCEKMTL